MDNERTIMEPKKDYGHNLRKNMDNNLDYGIQIIGNEQETNNINQLIGNNRIRKKELGRAMDARNGW